MGGILVLQPSLQRPAWPPQQQWNLGESRIPGRGVVGAREATKPCSLHSALQLGSIDTLAGARRRTSPRSILGRAEPQDARHHKTKEPPLP